MSALRTSVAAVTPGDPTLDAVQRLRNVLDRIGDALAAMDATALLTFEGELGAAVAAVGRAEQVGNRAATRAALEDTRTALLRCRRLGASFSGVRRTLGLAGPANGYNRAGSYVERAVHTSVIVRV